MINFRHKRDEEGIEMVDVLRKGKRTYGERLVCAVMRFRQLFVLVNGS